MSIGFEKRKSIEPREVYIERLDRSTENDHFVATTTEGNHINAKRVVLAPGFKHFAHVPDELNAKLPAGSFNHTAEFSDFSEATDKT